jgi:hypothetical protein
VPRALTILACSLLLGAGTPVGAQGHGWADRCAERLRVASVDLSAIASWAGGGTVEIIPLSAPSTGWPVTYQTDRVTALIQDYAGTTLAPWRAMGLGECPDESARPPSVARVRNYDGRQAQIIVPRASRRVGARIRRVLETALDECASY